DPAAISFTNPRGINDAGQIVGFYANLSNETGITAHGFLETTMPNPAAPAGTTADMVLRIANTSPTAGQYEIYDIGSNTILAGYSLGQVGTDWGFVTLGGFNGGDTTDMLLRNGQTGGFEVYDISNDVTGAAFLGNIGLDWQVMGFGNFSSLGETDMLLRNVKTGEFEVYDIANNQITSAFSLGAVGLDWQVAGFGPISGAGASDMVMRNTKTGEFEVYDLAHNQITAAASLGSVGLDWQLGGLAADAPGASSAAMGGASQVGQLVQAMASFGAGSGAGDGLNVVSPTQESSQQALLTPPHA